MKQDSALIWWGDVGGIRLGWCISPNPAKRLLAYQQIHGPAIDASDERLEEIAREMGFKSPFTIERPDLQCGATYNGYECVFGKNHLLDYHSDGEHRWSEDKQMSWEDVERDLGVKGPQAAQKKIDGMWRVIVAARGLINWCTDPQRNDPAQSKYVAAFIRDREVDLRVALESLQGPRT